VESIERFLAVPFGCGYGYGSGYGYGYSSGSGNGNGVGYGSGYGYSSGSGNGNGSGYGSGYGCGDGNGVGDGDGCGYGYSSGNGNGSGDGIAFIDNTPIYTIDGVPTAIYRVKGNIAQGAIVQKDLSLKPCWIAKVDGCFAHGETFKEAVADAKAKALESEPVESRVDRFMQQFPNGASGKELFDWHGILTTSCNMGRKNFVHSNEIDLDRHYTIEEFVSIAKDAYPHEAMNLLEKRLKQ
jgi:hypothetical protein